MSEELNLGLLVSQLLGYAIILGSLALKVPQILKLLSSKSADGLALSMFVLEIVVFTISLVYHNRKGYDFATYGESVFILVQVYVVVYLILSYRKQLFNPVTLISSALYVVAFAASIQGIVPLFIIEYLQQANLLFSIGSRLPQIYENFKNKRTGQLSAIMILLNVGGSLARVFTTIQQLSDPIILLGYSVSAFLNLVLLIQILLYSKNAGKPTPAVATPGKKSSPATRPKKE